jgi:hypothetical protein
MHLFNYLDDSLVISQTYWISFECVFGYCIYAFNNLFIHVWCYLDIDLFMDLTIYIILELYVGKSYPV